MPHHSLTSPMNQKLSASKGQMQDFDKVSQTQLKLGANFLEGQPEDNQSVYSGGSGLAPSLVSHTINYFP